MNLFKDVNEFLIDFMLWEYSQVDQGLYTILLLWKSLGCVRCYSLICLCSFDIQYVLTKFNMYIENTLNFVLFLLKLCSLKHRTQYMLPVKDNLSSIQYQLGHSFLLPQ